MKRRAKQPKSITKSAVITSASPEPPITRREATLVAIVVAAGILVRLFALSRTAVEHFDEGVYASNIYFPAPAYAYPQQRFYAPPLLPALIEIGMILGLPPNLAALLPSFLAGCATIIAVWWFGRSWFGPAAGLSAAVLVALSDFHVLLSTAALTDALLGLWLVLAIDAMARSLRQGDCRWALGAGLYTGLAWWTKYNGWLPLAIEAAALPLLWLLQKPPARHFRTWIGCFAATAIAACVAWSPYYFSLQATGGYAPIAENHAKYVVGLGGWIDAARRQTAHLVVLDTRLTPWALPLAIVIAAFYLPLRLQHRVLSGVMAAILGAASLYEDQRSLVYMWAAVALSLYVAGKKLWNDRPDRSSAFAFGIVCVIVWLVALSIATPLYMPYPRLVLPWLIAAWLLLGQGIDWILGAIAKQSESPKSRHEPLGALIAMSIAGIALAVIQPRVKSRPEGDRQSVFRAAQGVREHLGASEVRAVYVFGEPAMFFQLRAAGEEIVLPVDSVPVQKAEIERRAVPTYLLAGPHAQRDPKFIEAMKDSTTWKLVKEWDYEPSPLVWLDLHDPRKSNDFQESFKLFELNH